MKYCLTSVLLLVLLLSGTASAETVTVTTTTELQTALDYAAENPGTTVYLKGPFTYNVDPNQMYVGSYTTVTGDSTAIVKLKEQDYNFPTPSLTRAIFQADSDSTHDITFHGFTIDGNAIHSKLVSGNDHINMIQLLGSSNVTVYDMSFKNGLGDAVKVRDGNDINIYNNNIDKIGHDGIYLMYVFDASVHDNWISCRDDSGIRIVDSDSVKVYKNEITSENHGGAGIEIQKSTDVQMTVEIYENEIYHIRDAGIWLYGYRDSTAATSEIHVHDNTITECGIHRGGGVTIQGINVALENNKITGNHGYDVGIQALDINTYTADSSRDKPKGSGYKITLINNDIGSEVLNELIRTHTISYDSENLVPEKKSTGNIITVPECDGDGDQEQINAALKKAKDGGTVDLGSSTYIIDGPIWMYPGTILKGNGAVVRIDPDSSWWFREGVPVIGCKGTPHDIEISGFTVDGNCGAFSSSWANDGAGKSHNCMKLIILAGSSKDFGENIFIHGMTFINAFSDAVYIRYANNVRCEDNFISNCQHEGIYYSVVTNGIISGNKIAGITSDCARLDNCADCKIYSNVFFSYDGDTNTYKHGENGLQIGDAGVSNGYDGRKANFKTKNIEVYNNIFSDPGLKAIWLHEDVENVYIHDNEFVDADELVTDGIPVDISYENPPTQEQSGEVFGSIFDYMGLTSEYSYVSDTSDNSYYEGKLYTNTNDVDCVFEKHVTMGGNYTLIKIDTTDISSITYTINGSVSKHILKIGVRQGMNVIYSDSSIWEGNAEHDVYGNVFLNNTIDIENVSVQCTTPSGDVGVIRVHTVVNDGGTSINLKLLICILIVLLPALFGIILLRKLIRIIVMY